MRIEIPYSYDEITINQIQKHGEREISDFEKVLIYSSHDADYLKGCPHTLIQKASERLDQILENVSDVHNKVIVVNEVELGFIPDWDKLTAGEYIDLETYCDNPLQNAHKIMAILYRRIEGRLGEKYNIVPYDQKEDAQIFKDCPASYFTGCMVFFYNIRKELLTTSLHSLATMGEGMNTLNRGVGMIRFSGLLTKMLQKLKRLLGYQ